MLAKNVKQKIIEMLKRLPDDVDYDRAIEGIYVLRRIEIGLEQATAGKGTEHERFMKELLGEYEEEVPGHLDSASPKRSGVN